MLDPTRPRPFIIDGSKAVSKAIRAALGSTRQFDDATFKARSLVERPPPALHASVRRVLRQAWEMADAGKAETPIRNLARRLQGALPGSRRACSRDWTRSLR